MSDKINWSQPKLGKQRKIIFGENVRDYCAEHNISQLSFYLEIFGKDPKLKAKGNVEQYLAGMSGGRPEVYFYDKAYGYLAASEDALERQLAINISEEIANLPNASLSDGETIDVELVGSVGDAIEQIFAKRGDIIHIKNTHIVSHEEVIYTDEEAEKMEELFFHVLATNNGEIIDIFGGVGNSIALDQHELMTESIIANKAKFARYHPMVPETITATSPILPFVNFMLLQFKDRTEEIYFGWGGVKDDVFGDVFKSIDTRFIRVFGRVFETLLANAKKRTLGGSQGAS